MHKPNIDYMRIQTVKFNPNKMKRMNNGGRWIYKEGKKETLQTLAVITRLHCFYSQGGSFGNLPVVENPLNRIQIMMLMPDLRELHWTPLDSIVGSSSEAHLMSNSCYLHQAYFY